MKPHESPLELKQNQFVAIRAIRDLCGLGVLRGIPNHTNKSTAYKTLIRRQLEYASTVWSPRTAADTYKIEWVQRRAALWACCDYRQTSSVTKMLKNLHWRPLDQKRVDSHLVIMYKVTYDHVAIPASEHLIPNRRESKFIHPLARAATFTKFGDLLHEFQ